MPIDANSNHTYQPTGAASYRPNGDSSMYQSTSDVAYHPSGGPIYQPSGGPIYDMPGPLPRSATHRHTHANLTMQSNQPIIEPVEVPIKDNIRFLDCIWFQRWFMPWQQRPRRWQLWFVCDCAGIIACVFTWCLIVFGEVCLIVTVLIPFHNTPYAIFSGALNIFWAFLAFVAHLKSMFVDPVSNV